jgi:DNA-binding NarL/FixJ family response regulator
VVTRIGNREIADGLGISANTVKCHVANLLRKLGAHMRAELAAAGARG